jgi:hypothetical protein
MRVLGFAAAGALAAMAWASASALALPEFGRCEVSPTHEGRYTDNNCTANAKRVSTKFTGEFEWHKSTTFEGERVVNKAVEQEKTPVILNSVFIECAPSQEKLAKCKEGEAEERVAVSIECEGIIKLPGQFSTKSAKEITNYKSAFLGCHALGQVCANQAFSGSITGIVTDELRGALGYVKKSAPKEVGLEWKPESGREVAKFSCGTGMTLVVGAASEKEGPFYSPKGGGGGVIGTVSPINEMTENITQVQTANEETGENIPSNFEGKPLQSLEAYFYDPNNVQHGSRWSPVGETLTSKIRLCGCFNEVKTEIKA